MAELNYIATFKVYNVITDSELNANYSIEFNNRSGKYDLLRTFEFDYHYCGSFESFSKALHQAWYLTCQAFGKENVLDWDFNEVA